MAFTIPMGAKVKDKVTGLVGIVIGRSEYISGCNRILIQPPVGKAEKVPDCYSVDEHVIEVLELDALKLPKPFVADKPGGPMTRQVRP